MTDLSELIARVEREPENTICSVMLIDALMEYRDMIHSEAEHAVEKIVAVAREAAMITRAVGLLADGKQSKRFLLKRVQQRAQISLDVLVSVLVVTGDGLEINRPTVAPVPSRYWGYTLVLAGATWLCREWDNHHTAALARRRARYKTRA